MHAEKSAEGGFCKLISNYLGERIGKIKVYVDRGKSCTRAEIADFVYETTKTIWEIIAREAGGSREQAWNECMGMLKSIVNFELFHPDKEHVGAVRHVLEKKVCDVFERYFQFLICGVVVTKWPAPKVLGETDLVFCVDKPCNYTCNYGADWTQPADGDDPPMVPPISGVDSASALLNGPTPSIQIHEYLALKFDFATAQATRAWWKEKEMFLKCTCGRCEYCCMTSTGCCNRLDRETSGVMICAKTTTAYSIMRQQFASKHSVPEPQIEKFYLALVHNTVSVPSEETNKSQYWYHAPEKDGRGRIEICQRWNGRNSVAFDKGDETPPADASEAQSSLTFYEPLAFFSHRARNETYTLLRLQIVTGRRHQIRFHCSEIGHPLVGDEAYGAPKSDRGWARRVFLHSYITRFCEPGSKRKFEACSPLPQELGNVLEDLTLDRKTKTHGKPALLSRRKHDCAVLTQYDANSSLLKALAKPGDRSAHALEFPIENQRDCSVRGSSRSTPTVAADFGAAKEGNRSWSSDSWKESWSSDSWKKSKELFGERSSFSDSWKESWTKSEWHDDYAPKESWTKSEWRDDYNSKESCMKSDHCETPASKESWMESEQCEDPASEDDMWGEWGPAHSETDPGPQSLRVTIPDQNKNYLAVTPTSPFSTLKRSNVADCWPSREKRVRPSSAPSIGEIEPSPIEDFGGAKPSSVVDSSRPVAVEEIRPSQLGVVRPPATSGIEPSLVLPPVQPPIVVPLPVARPPEVRCPCTPASLFWKRMESRSQKGLHYYFNSVTGECIPDPPPPWEKRTSRKNQNVVYYWNTITGATSLVKPEI